MPLRLNSTSKTSPLIESTYNILYISDYYLSLKTDRVNYLEMMLSISYCSKWRKPSNSLETSSVELFEGYAEDASRIRSIDWREMLMR
jgi:hypothetical protein